jgi:hypothetical protein
MRDAVKNLIDARDRIQIQINRRNRQQLAGLRNFDRMQQQKIRRPKSDEEAARKIAQRLEELANDEDFVYATLAGLLDPDQKPMEGQPPMPMANSAQGAGNSEKPMPMPMPGSATGSSPMPGETKATDLAKERMTATAKAAEDAAEEIGAGALKDARATAGVAREQLRELAQQVKALLAEEQAERIAAAQQIAANLARMQEDFVDRLWKMSRGQALARSRRRSWTTSCRVWARRPTRLPRGPRRWPTCWGPRPRLIGRKMFPRPKRLGL